MPVAVHTPWYYKSPVKAEEASTGVLRYRKKVLPVGDVEYQGRTLHFTPGYLKGLAESFSAGAYDQVPFQLADAQNTHTNDPERFRGQIVSMDAQPDGLWITLAPTSDGEKVILDNPKLGVSARIVEDYARSDGKFFPAAVQHVLGTLDPRIPGLGGWEAVEMSNREYTTIDLTGARFSGEEGTDDMPLTDEQNVRLAKLLDIPPEKFEQLLAAVSAPELTEAEIRDLMGEPAGDAVLTDAELEELVSAAVDLDASGQLGVPVTAGLTAEAQMAIEMANARTEANAYHLSNIQRELDSSKFDAERNQFISDLGLTPVIMDLARPLLEGTGHVVDLSNGQSVDAGTVMRRVLIEVGKTVRMLDLGNEMGSAHDEPDQGGQRMDNVRSIADRFKQQTGLG
ncbi:MAG TPA: hypothetical protein VGI66_00915 [Streptosporangiaceae bacterium]|jgi:hypothetical protein